MKKTARDTIKKQAIRQFLQVFLLSGGLVIGAGLPKIQAKAIQTVVSHGNLVYEGKRGNACLYAADILLLEEKISTIPAQCFDPASYVDT